jgi:hypothetical protein
MMRRRASWRQQDHCSSRSGACTRGSYQQAIHVVASQRYWLNVVGANHGLFPLLVCMSTQWSLCVRVVDRLLQMRSDREAAAKTKAEAKQKAQQEADKYVPIDQRKLPSPIKKCPELERARAMLHKGDRKVCPTHVMRMAARFCVLSCNVNCCKKGGRGAFAVCTQ